MTNTITASYLVLTSLDGAQLKISPTNFRREVRAGSYSDDDAGAALGSADAALAGFGTLTHALAATATYPNASAGDDGVDLLHFCGLKLRDPDTFMLGAPSVRPSVAQRRA